MMNSIFPLVIAICLTILLILLLTPIAQKIGLVDYPNDRKKHETPVPLVGGIAISLSIFLSLLLFTSISFQSFRIFVFCLAVLMITGVLDDYREIHAKSKFFVQLGIAVLLVTLDNRVITHIGDIFSLGESQGLRYLAIPFTVIAIVGVINAFNMIDGHDGICGLVTIISGAALLFLYIIRTPGDITVHLQNGDFVILSLLLATVPVFLFFNLKSSSGPTRQIFLGDAGSMFLGLIIVFFLIEFSDKTPIVLKATAAAWIIGLPLLDMVSVITFRLAKKRSLTQADRTHFHHFLVSLKISRFGVILIMTLIHTTFVSVGVAGTLLEWPDWALFWFMIPILVAYYVFTLYASKSTHHQR